MVSKFIAHDAKLQFGGLNHSIAAVLNPIWVADLKGLLARIKSYLIGDCGADERDLPPSPKVASMLARVLCHSGADGAREFSLSSCD
jgi:hypothetical protein